MSRFLFGAVGFSVGLIAAIFPPSTAQAGERVYCVLTMPTDAGAYSTAEPRTVTGCPAARLQVDGGLLAADGGFYLPDGGVAGCPDCSWGKAQSLFVQCDNPVYYSETPSGTTNIWNQKEVTAATSSDVLIDFDINADPYRIDLRGQGQHLSLLSTTTDANTCKVGTVERHIP